MIHGRLAKSIPNRPPFIDFSKNVIGDIPIKYLFKKMFVQDLQNGTPNLARSYFKQMVQYS